MKKGIICFLLLFFISLLFATPEITFESLQHDFGDIKEETGPYECIFRFTNTGNEDLKLTKVKAGCGCTLTSWSIGMIHPNEKGEIKISYKSNNRPGKFHKSVIVKTNISDKSISLDIYGNVIPTQGKFYPKMTIGGIQFDKKYIKIKKISNIAKKEFSVTLYNSEKYSIKIKIDSQPKYILAKLSQTVLKPKERCELKGTYISKKADKYGQLIDGITFSINGKHNDKKYIIKSYRYKNTKKLSDEEKENAPHISLIQKKIAFSHLKNNSGKYDRIVFENSGKDTLSIFNINHSNSIKIIEYPKKLRKGTRGILKIEIKNKRNLKKFKGFIKIYSNDPLSFETTITISGKSFKTKSEKFDRSDLNYISTQDFLSLHKKMKNIIFLKDLFKKHKVSSYSIIDVRSKDDFRKEHFGSSQNLPLKSNEFNKKLNTLDKEETLYYVIGNNFKESNTAIKILIKNGIKKVICVKGGYKDFSIKK